jgi:hypothetical protein
MLNEGVSCNSECVPPTAEEFIETDGGVQKSTVKNA